MRGLGICTVLIFCFSSAHAGFLLDLDHACYRVNDSLSYVEVFVGVQRAHLSYVTHADTQRAEFRVLLVLQQDGLTVIADTFAAEDVLPVSEQPSQGQFFPHVFAMIMKAGWYQLRADLYQDGPDPRDTVLDSLEVRTFRADSLDISEIEIGCSMTFDSVASRFTKNGVRLLPNPTGFFGSKLPMFYYYAEGYGLPYESVKGDSHVVVRRVLDAQSGQPAREDLRRWKRTAGSTTVIADGFPIATLRTGTYFLELAIETADGAQKAASARKKFWIYRPEDFAPGRMMTVSSELQSKLLATAPSSLDVVDPDSALMWMRYVLTKPEQHRVERLNAEGKREFLRLFWKERELSKPGAANQYFARVAETNRRFTHLGKAGWRTDRGRVFILYGEPDNTVRNYAIPHLPDHEMWEYNRLEGGVIFIFLDRSGFGDLDLVHSTMRGEIYNPNWHSLSPSAHPTDEE